MLHESQEEIKELRSKNTPSAGLRRHYGLYPMVRNADLLLLTSVDVQMIFFLLIQAYSVTCTCGALLDILNALLFTLQSIISFCK